MKKINISEPYFNQEETDEITQVLRSKWVTQGPKTEAFEKAFAQYHGVKHGIAVTSCTTGLELILRALGIGQGDEVIIPSLSWVATANAIKILGAIPIFVDVEKLTCNLDLQTIQCAITPKTKAIIPVHLFGRCIDISALKKILPPSILIIEDAACAIGASYDGKFCGQESDGAVFSFHPRKVITTGEGGMMLVNDDQLALKLRQLRNHGQCPYPSNRADFKYISDVDELGFNYRMTDIQSAMGLAQLKKLDFLIQHRQEVASWYFEVFQGADHLLLPAKPVDIKERITWQSFVVLLNTPHLRDECMAYLQTQGIQTRPATHCMPLLSYYYDEQRDPQSYAVAHDIFVNSISLPIYVGLTKEDILYIYQAFENFFKMKSNG
jgi:perosamine synthetase